MDDRLFDDLIAFEEGRLEEQVVIQLFQRLIDTGHAWRLQGMYGRMARTLIDDGLCMPAKQAKEQQ